MTQWCRTKYGLLQSTDIRGRSETDAFLYERFPGLGTWQMQDKVHLAYSTAGWDRLALEGAVQGFCCRNLNRASIISCGANYSEARPVPRSLVWRGGVILVVHTSKNSPLMFCLSRHRQGTVSIAGP